MMNGTRNRQRPLRVYVNQTEREEIAQRAGATNLSTSAYLRNLAIGHQPRSQLDAGLILKIVKVNADQGRLGGLLKLWLTAKPGEGAGTHEVRKLLRRIEALQVRLKELVKQL